MNFLGSFPLYSFPVDFGYHRLDPSFGNFVHSRLAFDCSACHSDSAFRPDRSCLDFPDGACPDSVRNPFGPVSDRYYSFAYRHICHCHWMRRRGPLLEFHPMRSSHHRIYPHQRAFLLFQWSFGRIDRFRHPHSAGQNIGTYSRFFSQLESSDGRSARVNHRLYPPVRHSRILRYRR